MPELLNRQMLNALSKAKDACIRRGLACDAPDKVELSWAVNQIYLEATGMECPEIRIAEGPFSAKKLIEERTDDSIKGCERKNYNDLLFTHVISSAEKCLYHLKQEAPGSAFSQLQNMVFRDLNARISHACADPVRTRLSDAGVFPAKYALRPAVSPSWGDLDWVRFYEICESSFGMQFPLPEGYSEFLSAGGMILYAFSDFAVAVLAPVSVSFNGSFQLHGDEAPAVAWSDGTKLYFHNGVAVPEKLMEHPESITREDIMDEENAEVRRCYREILGSERFGKLLGIEVVDEDTDRFGYELTLYRTERKDKIAGNYIQFAGVTCPSTARRYFLCVPPHIKSAREAVAWTFGKTPEDYRPEIET